MDWVFVIKLFLDDCCHTKLTEVISSANQKKDRYHKDSLNFKVNPSTPV